MSTHPFDCVSRQTSKDGEWKKVKEVVVISHTHQVMFWHMMVSEYFRLSTLLPYVQANEHIYIHLGWQFPNPLIKSLYAFLNISEYVSCFSFCANALCVVDSDL